MAVDIDKRAATDADIASDNGTTDTTASAETADPTAVEGAAEVAGDEDAQGGTDAVAGTNVDDAKAAMDSSASRESGDAVPAPRAWRLRRALVALGVIALVTGIGVLGWQWWQQHTETQLRESAASEASRMVAQLATYDYTDVEANLNAVIADATPEFGNRYREVAAGLEEILVNGQGSSTGTVTHAAVEVLTDDHATVLVFLDQEVTNLAAPEGRIDASRMVVGLVRDGDRWLLDSADLA